MKFQYKFSNLLGTVYRQGDLLFTSDGNSVISPVGNRITIYDLKNNKAFTLPVESRFNYNALDLSPNGCTLIAINEEGEAHMISLVSHTIIHKYRFKRKVNCIKFSPDGKHFAVCKENNVFVFNAPGPFSGEYNAFIMERVFHSSFDETTCLDWSADSKIIAAGSKDMIVRLYPLERWENFKQYMIGGHQDTIVACFFEENSLDLTTISKNGHTCVWECSISASDLKPESLNARKSKKQKISSDSEDDIDPTKCPERNEQEIVDALKEVQLDEAEENADQKVNKLFYKRLTKHYLADEVRKTEKGAVLTAAAYHKGTKILVTGFSTGAFFIHELPNVIMIHSLSISEQQISTITLNSTGDWIALGCAGQGQLLVWEWQSETYVMKQQGHSNNMSCVAYSSDGIHLATGGEDGKVKLWNVHSGCCTVTFNEHSNAVTAVAFSGNKKFVVSASLDGTVRAYDVIRYRNFRTLASPRPVQFACVTVDSGGEFIAAGGQDVFEIYLWSVKLGRLLEILSGHEGPVWSVAFSPSAASTMLASVSWDKTLRIWDALEKSSAHETIEICNDGLCVVFKPDATQVAVATLDGQINIFDVKTGSQVKSIEGRDDLGSGRTDTDLVTAKQSLKAKSFTSLCYTADGECLIAGGQSKNVCIYNVEHNVIIKKFEVTQNRSFDGVDDFINRRKITEFGNVALVEQREEREGGNISLRLPGVRKGDMADRIIKPEVRIFAVQFSPTGQQWAAATTEGLLIYSLNVDLMFDPWNLEMNITPSTVREAISKEDYLNALMMSMKLNQANLIMEVIENVPVKDVELLISGLTEKYIERLVLIIASALDSSRHLEFYLIWTQNILTIHGLQMKAKQNLPALISLQKSLSRKYEQIAKICDFNKYTLQYIAQLGDNVSKTNVEDVVMQSKDEESDDEDAEDTEE